MKYRNVALFGALVLSGAVGTASVSAGNAATCPTIEVTGGQVGASGAKFVANVANSDGDVTYNWTISAGMIESGQGTPVISVVEVGEPGTTVTATVDIGGMSPECNRNESWTVEIMAADA